VLAQGSNQVKSRRPGRLTMLSRPSRHSAPVRRPLVVTTSWDDGHPLDLRVAELLDKHGLRGTFYIPCRGPDDLPVMRPTDILQLATRFEIAGHTRDHIDLTRVPRDCAAQQILANKCRLEDLLGHEISGFAYVRGKYNRSVRDLAVDAGFKYARTVKTFMTRPAFDPFQLGTTAQFFPHTRATLISNFLTQGPTRERSYILGRLLSDKSLSARLLQVAEASIHLGGYFHFWAHSRDLDAYDLWQEFEYFLRELQHFEAHFLPNSAVYTYSDNTRQSS
jgi:peptidoglycan-N-acetylglucosamine deacetylase